MNYTDFLSQKVCIRPDIGFDPFTIEAALKDFQIAIVNWAVRKGCAALFCDTGLGKTLMQLEWARQVHLCTGRTVLILAPLAVAQQTGREGAKFGYKVKFCRIQEDVEPGINIANYEMLHAFDASSFAGVVLDESSILKSFMGKTKRSLCAAFKKTRFKLACTATPAPNDHMEIGNHAEFLNVMPASEMLTRFFVHDSANTQEWRLKGHAASAFWEWVASWAICVSKPSDIGFSDEGYILPELKIHTISLDSEYAPKTGDDLFPSSDVSATNLHKSMRLSLDVRCRKAAELANSNNDYWAVWTNLNEESDLLEDLLKDAVHVRGSDRLEHKEKRLEAFSNGEVRVMETKASIAGFGLNWQHCCNVVCVGLNYSYEMLYQLIRRFWRFGQKRVVNVYLLVTERESGVLQTILRKQKDHQGMQKAMYAAQNKLRQQEKLTLKNDFEHKIAKGKDWELHLGDSCELIKKIKSNSIDFGMHSPPFSNLYTYSDSIRDMGNSTNDEQFFEHYDFIIKEHLRITKPGRLVAVHCTNLAKFKGRDGQLGRKDFRGEIIRHYEAAGWQFWSEVTIWKDPVTEMQRTKAHGLLYKTLKKNSTFSRQGFGDYLIVFRKFDGEEKDPVTHTEQDFDLDDWQKIASPVWITEGYEFPAVWFDIVQSNVLNKVRDQNDEKHICPLQLDVIERALKLWTNPGDVVFSPFAGIGSEGFVSIQMGRKFKGIELKETYWNAGAEYLNTAEHTKGELFDQLEVVK